MPLLFGLMSSTVHQRVVIGIKVQLLSVPSYAMRILLFIMPGVPLVFVDVRTFHPFIWIGDTEYHRLIRPTTPLAFLLLRMLPFSTSCMATLTYFSTSPLSKNLTDTYRGLLPSTAQPLDPNRNLSPTRHGISISLSSLSPAAADAYTPTISQSAIPCTVLDSPLLI